MSSHFGKNKDGKNLYPEKGAHLTTVIYWMVHKMNMETPSSFNTDLDRTIEVWK